MNRSVGPVVLGGLAAVIAAGCAAPGLTPVTGPGQRFELQGLSATAPPGRGWHVDGARSTSRRIFFVKRLEADPARTVAAVAQIGDSDLPATTAEELYEVKRRAVERRGQEDGIPTVLRQLVVDRARGAECVRWEQVEEERNSPQPALRQDVFITVTRGFDCLHPQSRWLLVTVAYTERRIRGTPSLLDAGQALATEGESFLRGIVFRPLR